MDNCPQCGGSLVLKQGRFGEFTACANYPRCKYVQPKTTGIACPSCSEGQIIERRSRQGRTFFGCDRYPECGFVSSAKPVAGECPECGAAYLVEKRLKSRVRWHCPNDGCDYTRPAKAGDRTMESRCVSPSRESS